VYERFGDQQQYTYVMCQSCQLIYQSPRPKYDDSFVYDAYEFYADDDVKFDASGESFMGQTKEDYEREVAELLKYDTIRSAVLDVGCATGDFLSVAQNHYQSIHGLDVSSRMAAVVKRRLGTDISLCSFDQLQTDQQYSCIRISHVIEHIPNPHDWLRKAKTMTMEGGIVVINVPNMFSADRRFKLALKKAGLRKGNWQPWRTPDHLYQPTVAAMMKLFEMNDYDVLDYYTYSRKDITATSPWSKLYQRKWKIGSNLRFYLRPNQ
jgi:2-polyprenyl-3-methyl-5-hydroxy-6-metoxy-1,4-benzoquinol methylase